MAGLNAYAFFLVLGVLPSALWLLFFLRKDKHPEPRGLLLLVFVAGALAGLPVALVETWFLRGLNLIPMATQLSSLVFVFVGVALTEEFAKYAAVRFTALKTREVDEPIDLPMYMIVSALGFAAAENVLALFALGSVAAPAEFAVLLITFRFAGAVFLHAAASGILGYFLALRRFFPRHNSKLFVLGLAVATGLHGSFNLTIMRGENVTQMLWPLFIILFLAVFISLALNSLAKQRP